MDRASYCRALDARDPRFDGVFFVGITTTGIYCRPVCPARRARRDRCRFFSHAAAAERVGFRPCLRCRPELAPGRASVDAVPRVAWAAARRIAAGGLNGRSVDDLARELGIGGRQLRRAVKQELGVSPVELAQTHRLLLAKQLLTDTRLGAARVAFASGFQSLRRFNALFRERYGLNPAALRKRANGSQRAGESDLVRLTLAYRPPLAWDLLIGFLAARATPGVEQADDRRYARVMRIGDHTGFVRIEPAGQPSAGRSRRRPEHALHVELSASLVPVLMPLLARLRRLFDLDAEPATIEAHLASAGLGALIRRQRGLRIPGSVDGFELALRAVLGQQVSVKGATTLAGRFAAAFGESIETGDSALNRLAPTAERIAEVSIPALASLGIPRARAASVHALAQAVADGRLVLEPSADIATVTRQLAELPGIGPWTVQYIAMRALSWPDAFPAADLWLRRAAGGLSAAELLRNAEAWRPWRAYAAMHLWASLGHSPPALVGA